MKRLLLLSAVLFATFCANAAKKSSRNFQSLAEKKAIEEEAAKKAALEKAKAKAPPPKAPAQRLQFMGPKTGWGVVSVRTPYYNGKGKNLGKVEAGRVFSYSNVVETKGNSMLVAVFAEPQEGPFLLDCAKAATYEGELANMDPALVAKLSAYFTAKGKADARKKAIEEEAFEKNPHLATARRSQQALQDSIRQADALEAKMNASQGSVRSKLQDQLRELKYRQQGLKQTADNDAAAYRLWKQEHPLSPNAVSGDAQWKALDAERKTLRTGIEKLLPPE